MSALNGYLQAHANGCDFYESGFTDYCTCGRFEARQEYKMLLARIAELEAFLGEYGSCEECELHRTWQPIETAPKSRSILALDKIGEWMVSVEWDEHEDCWIDYEGQLYRDNYFDYWTENLPLPKPPEEK